MALRGEIQIGLVIAIVLAALALIFSLWVSIVIMSGVLVVVSVTPSKIGIDRWLLVRLMMVVMGLGYLGYGMWSSYILQTTSSGFGSYSWYLAQANVLAGIFSLGMGMIFSKNTHL
jgi:hypothetical protein